MSRARRSGRLGLGVSELRLGRILMRVWVRGLDSSTGAAVCCQINTYGEHLALTTDCLRSDGGSYSPCASLQLRKSLLDVFP